MCGIWFYWSRDRIQDFHTIYHQNKNVVRRGPDRSLAVLHNHFVLVFHRLAFHDQTPVGDQPFVFYEPDKTVYLVVNGEIYNYRYLIDKYGIEMRSGNDCEVIYHLYNKLNKNMKECVDELDGEFAFVWVEVTKNKIMVKLGRDGFGVRPLFYSIGKDFFGVCSILKDLSGSGRVFPPGVISEFVLDDSFKILPFTPFFNWIEDIQFFKYTSESLELYRMITDSFIEAVRKRLDSERPIGCLISGGLDSSLVAAVVTKIFGQKDVQTFSIGMEGSTDLDHADIVSHHIGSNHHRIVFTEQEGIDSIHDVIKATETWDVTTIRASVGQFLMAKYIRDNTDCKMILNGDGSDELLMGYLYWYYAPNPRKAHDESIRRLQEIHLYDALRVDRCLGYHGLEARFPFLDKDFASLMLKTDPRLRIPTASRMEKYLLRRSFQVLYPDLLPREVLWRKKEAFSDGVSSKTNSWFQTLQKYCEERVSDEQLMAFHGKIKTKEACYYYAQFCKSIGEKNYAVIPGYWLPLWTDSTEPSARSLQIYEK